jgi:hypothetical protein
MMRNQHSRLYRRSSVCFYVVILNEVKDPRILREAPHQPEYNP